MPDPRSPGHGAGVPRGLDVEGEEELAGRFGRMFRPAEETAGPATIEALVAAMRARAGQSDSNMRISAGYTYLGQFIDHDITFDPTSSTGREIDPRAVRNFRTPRLDLDSVYGSGPRVHPFLYDRERKPRGAFLLIDRHADGHEDLPRNSQGRALVADARNDENALVAQVHLLFLRFHNAVVDRLLADGCDEEEVLSKARRIVRWHYQWLVVHDFLETVAGRRMAHRVLAPAAAAGGEPEVNIRWFKRPEDAYMPVEFSVAAFRFGHSMVRRDYRVRCPKPGERAVREPLDLFTDLRGERPLEADVVVDWERFFKLDTGGSCQIQHSLNIDTSLSPPLFALPDERGVLAQLNLERGRKLRLPSGQALAKRMEVAELEADELQLDDLPESARRSLLRDTPLWYYLLAETVRVTDDELPDRPVRPGTRLGDIGGRIVAEVLVGLLESDPTSYLARKPAWRPTLGKDGDFTMADLIAVARGAG